MGPYVIILNEWIRKLDNLLDYLMLVELEVVDVSYNERQEIKQLIENFTDLSEEDLERYEGGIRIEGQEYYQQR